VSSSVPAAPEHAQLCGGRLERRRDVGADRRVGGRSPAPPVRAPCPEGLARLGERRIRPRRRSNRVHNLKRRYKKVLLAEPPPSGWPHLPRVPSQSRRPASRVPGEAAVFRQGAGAEGEEREDGGGELRRQRVGGELDRPEERDRRRGALPGGGGDEASSGVRTRGTREARLRGGEDGGGGREGRV
jgi:hypothetical protein